MNLRVSGGNISVAPCGDEAGARLPCRLVIRRATSVTDRDSTLAITNTMHPSFDSS
jgi:hypothetical protein